MISYELALKLKEAGFPESDYFPIGCQFYWADIHKLQIYDPENYKHPDEDNVKIPTLSELIEACGNKFGRLDRYVEEFPPIMTWIAYSSKRPNELNIPAYIVQQGESPEEAVANLWLALNKK